MADQGNQGNNDAQNQRNIQNNAQNINRVADIASKSGHPVASGVGKAYKAANKISGGKLGNAVAKRVEASNQMSPFGRGLQKLSNGINEGGLGNRLGNVGRQKLGRQNGGSSQMGGGRRESLPSSVSNRRGVDANASSSSDKKKSSDSDSTLMKNTSKKDQDEEKKEEEKKEKTTSTGGDVYDEDQSALDTIIGSKEDRQNRIFGKISIPKMLLISAIIFLFFGILLLLIIVLGVANFDFMRFDDAEGLSYATGESMSENSSESNPSEEQDAFYSRVSNVKNSMQARGRTFAASNIAAVYSVLNSYGGFGYEDMSEYVIENIANAMFNGNDYDESTFRSNLTNNIFPTYIPGATYDDYESYADEVFEFINDYSELNGNERNSSNYDSSSISSSVCSSGKCSYDIKGFYVSSRGNVKKEMQISNLYVRLMQCGSFTSNDGKFHDYGGTFGKPLAGEELVPFEKYILGVAYAEIGGSLDRPEAFKAQTVAARSYILSRHLDGSWRTLQQEGDKWVLQAASCTLDQVYCDPDRGCSSNSGQWGQIHSGLNFNNGYSKQPLPANSPLRTYASQTNGEVLVNDQGYIIRTGYNSTLQKKMIAYGNSGMNYKRILLQAYNEGDYKFGATDVVKHSCEFAVCPATGNFVNWKQYEGPWTSVPVGNSGKTIKDIGCLVTSVAIQIARSGVPTNVADFNPGTFVQKLNQTNGFTGGGLFLWNSASNVAPTFKWVTKIDVGDYTKEQKLNKIKELTSQGGVYVVAQVNVGRNEHWVAIDSVNGDKVKMMDPGSKSTDMWGEYNWANTKSLSYFKVS